MSVEIGRLTQNANHLFKVMLIVDVSALRRLHVRDEGGEDRFTLASAVLHQHLQFVVPENPVVAVDSLTRKRGG